MSKEFYEKIMADIDFREEFKNDPGATFKKYDINIYENKKIIVHENTTTEMHYALLPEGIDIEDLNLPEEFKKIQKKAWEDKEYLNKLLSDSKNAITQVFGTLPEALKMNFYEYRPDKVHVVIPALKVESDELSDDDLEMVAGGKGGARKAVVNECKDVGNFFKEAPRNVKKNLKKYAGFMIGW